MLRILALSFAVATSADAQMVITEPFQLEDDFSKLEEKAQVMNRWTERHAGVDAEKVRRTLEESGFTVDFDAPWLNSADDFTIYSSTSGPGQVGYLVVPNSSDAAPVTFAPALTGYAGEIKTELYNTAWTSEIGDRILAGMKSSITSVCGMGAEPESITGQASAGFIQVAATWRGSAICEAAGR